MSKRDQHDGTTDSPLDTAMTIVSGRRDDAAAGAPEAEAARPHPTEVTVSGPDAAAAEAPHATEVTIPLADDRDTTMTVPMDHPPVGGGAAVGELQPGDRIERYVIVKRLGKGGMGSVYLARHETLGVFRAIKVLSGALYQRGREFTKRFIQEARIASSISDPNIVNVLDVGEDPERSFCYIIMEYVDGGTVRDVLKRIPRLGELHAVVIAEAVAVALNAAAEQRIVHRDIKPDNIMLTRRGEVKLADLGIAKNTDENVQLTKSHVMMGTPAYLAPEQAQDAHSVDVRADIYSLGATLFEMLTGRLPYPGKSTYDILRKLVSEPVPDPRSIVDTISAPTAHLVMRMLAKQAKQRPQNAAELLKEIHKLNFLPADLDTKKCIRELLEQTGEGSYSAASCTPAAGNTVSSWFARHILLRAETALRKLPLFASLLDAMRREVILSRIIIALLAVLLIALPTAWFLTRRGGAVAKKDFNPAVVTLPPAAVPPKPPETAVTPEPKTPATPPAAEKPKDPTTPPAAEKPKAPATPPAAEKPKDPTPPPAAEKPKDPTTPPAAEKTKDQPPKTAEKPKAPTVKPVRKSNPPEPPKPAAVKPPVAPPRVKEVRKIGFSADISPAGARVVLRNDAGRVIESRIAPPTRRLEFRVPAGQYKLEVSAPGFTSAEREFPLSENRAISSLKIDLRREVASCRIEFYGLPKLLAYLNEQGVELRIDGGKWQRISEFPFKIELPRTTHTVDVRGQGIQPVNNHEWPIASDQTRSTLEVFLQEKKAVLKLVPAVGGKIMINIFGIWEDLRSPIEVQPFEVVVLRWKTENGVEQELKIPELLPGAVREITLKEPKKTAFEGAEEFAAGEALVKSGKYSAAAEKLKAAAAKGNPEAMYLLGWMAEEGKGRWFASAKDALAEYRKAASAPYEYARAQYKMGDFCEHGRGGLDRDLKQAIVWYKKAAAQNDPDALFRMARVYRDGDGEEPVSDFKMFEFLSAAAERGHLEAQYQTGYCYENGIGVPVNIERAKTWYSKAAARGHAEARTRVNVKGLEGIK